jgi:NAD(P)H-hydrate epimerase
MPGLAVSLTRDEVRAFDRRAIEGLGLPGAVLMENAGRSVAEEALRLLAARGAAPGRVVVLCGAGNNGGDGYVIARHLHNAGVEVRLCSSVPAARLAGDAALNRRVAEALGLAAAPIGDPHALAREAPRWDGADVLVDALLGTGFRGEVRPPLDAVIAAANAAAVGARLAVDLPSGLDCDSGEPAGTTFRADVTVTFVARKRGFDRPSAADWTGRVVVAGIGVPFPGPGPRPPADSP